MLREPFEAEPFAVEACYKNAVYVVFVFVWVHDVHCTLIIVNII